MAAGTPRALRTDAVEHRAAIVRAASQVLAGSPQSGVAAVAAAAGLSRTTVYAHFPSRRELVEAVVRAAIDAGATAWDAAEGGGPAAESLPRVLRGTWQVLTAHPGVAVAAGEVLGHEHLAQLHEPLRRRVRALVRRGRSDGSFADDVSEDWAVTLWFAAVHAAGDLARAAHPTDRVGQDLVTTLGRALAP